LNPLVPSGLEQRAYPSGAAIPEGGSATSIVTLVATITDPDVEDRPYADFEIRRGNRVEFSTSLRCASSNSCTLIVDSDPLLNNAYTWRVRTRDPFGVVSAWAEFGTAGTTDFVVDLVNAGNGAVCATGSQCATGFCADARCCNTACNGACEACNATGTEGTCIAYPSGTDPEYECPGSSPCGGACTGNRSCNTQPQGVPCNTYCSGDTFYNYECNGTGSCSYDNNSSCSPYLCTYTGYGGTCRTSCSGNFDCVYGAICVNSQCVLMGANGEQCSTGAECGSGNCADGVCCDQPCLGECEKCNVSQNVGYCIAVPNATDPDDECPGTGACGGVCNGARQCGYPTNTTSCGPTTCINATLTGQACDGAGGCEQAVVPCSPYQCANNGTSCRTSCNNSSHCAPGATCSGNQCVGLSAVGEACALDGECASGFCADGVCCSTRCGGTCQQCDATPGTCTMVAPNADPRGDCEGTSATCAGTCDGAGACTGFPLGGMCGEPSCLNEYIVDLACDGAGNCLPASTDCQPYACDPGSVTCRTACTTDAHCAPGHTCRNGACQPLPGNGTPCTTGSECNSGYCADGFCCNSPCTGVCRACDVAGQEGSCRNVPDNQDPDNECTGTGTCGGHCNGLGACEAPTGGTCAAATCTGEELTTFACNGAGACLPSIANCAPYACNAATDSCYTSCSDDTQCASGLGCLGGQCVQLLPDGASCGSDFECLSGYCVDRVCCDQRCDGTCRSCAFARTLGLCTNTASTSDPENECAGVGTCGGACDGNGGCYMPAAATPCGADQCVGSVLTQSRCDGVGGCQASATDCAPFVCRNAACIDSCTSNADCAAGNACVNGNCESTDAGVPDTGPVDSGPPPELIIHHTANATAAVGVPYAFDPDGRAYAAGQGPVTWSTCGVPAGFRIEPTSGVVSWTPASTGDFPICLSAISPNDDDQYVFDVGVVDAPGDAPTAVLIADPIEGQVRLDVAFDGSMSRPIPGSALLGHEWTFGDGSNREYVPITRHTYLLPGGYVSRLKVVDVLGVSDTEAQTIAVLVPPNVRPPLAQIQASALSGSEPLEVQFGCDCQEGDTAIRAYVWNFGDGTTSAELAPRNLYAAGTYDVSLEVVDEYGLTAIDRVQIVVSQAANLPPQCYVSASPPAGPAPLDVGFSAVFYDPDGDLVSRGWTFDDGYQSTEPTLLRHYGNAGNHAAEFRAVDSTGAPCSARVEITVLSPEGVRPPRIVSIPNGKTTCFEPYQYDGDARVSAAGEQPMTWTIGQRIGDTFIGAPAGMSIDPASGEITWIPPVGAPTTEHVVVTVRNEAGIDVQTFDVEVACGGVLTGDGGGSSSCSCNAARENRSPAIGLLLLGWLVVRRRKKSWLAGLIALWPSSASANVTPYTPTMLSQTTPTGTAIAEGGNAPARINLQARFSDFDCEDTLYSDFEILLNGVLIMSVEGSCVPSTNGSCPPNDCTAVITPSSLVNGNYIWRVRTRDVLGDSSPFVEFGAANVTDFVVNINNAPNGTACAVGTQCSSTFCTDGYCCNNACNTECRSCGLTGTLGACTAIANGQDPENECPGTHATCGGRCNGAGACFTPAQGTECGNQYCSGSSHYGYECNGTGSCQYIYETCSPYICANNSGCRTSCSNNNQCAYSASCINNQCVIPGANGEPCLNAVDCASGFCADGVCCDSGCGGVCESCSNASGTCTPIAAGTDPANECAGAGTCGGTCDGASGCGFPSSSTSCGATTCSNATLSGFVCDGGGMCISSMGNCGAYQCDATGTACRTSCTLDTECAGGATCELGRCVGANPNGTPCSSDSQCGSGFCSDGFCCNARCGETCRSCAVPNQEGSCILSPNGTDPGGDCAGDQLACDGACNGNGACIEATGACGTAACLGDSLIAPACSSGACSTAPTSCFPYTCNGSTLACRTTCTSNLDCAEGARCNGGRCVGYVPIGGACSSDVDCASGVCADGLCCDGPCGGSCEACDLAGYEGRCTFVPPGTDPDNECPGAVPCGGNCDGGGACTTVPQGVTCGQESCGIDAIESPICDGYGTCSIASQSCGLYACDPSRATCFNTCTTNAECSEFAACDNGMCRGLLPVGRGCTAGSQCGSGYCVDGVCCDSACTGSCESCGITGSLGRCTFWPGGQDPEDECFGTGSCGGTCNGGGACNFPNLGTSCGANLCVGTVLTSAGCDGIGSCIGVTTDCAPWDCIDGACNSSCTSDSDCAEGARCYGGNCTFPDAGVRDIGPDSGPHVDVEIEETANLVGVAGVSYAYDEDGIATALGAPPLLWSRCGGPVGFRVELETGVVSWTPAAGGAFELCIRAENADDFDEYRFNVEVRAPEAIEPPNAVIAADPIQGPATLPVAFDASGSTPVPGSTILSLRWTFGDGSPGVYGQATSHEYALAGSFVSRLRLTDVLGLTDEADQSIVVLDGDRIPPSGRIVVDNSSGTTTLDVAFQCDCAPGSAPISAVSWDFGDGTSSSELSPTKVFRPGNHEVALVVVDENGLTAMDQRIITVREPEYVPPQCSASAAPPSGPVPLDVSFNAAFFDPDGSITEHTWMFDDGLEIAEIDTQRRYSTPGTYRAYFRAIDETGLPCTSQVTITALSAEGHRAPRILSVPTTTARCREPYQYDSDNRASSIGTEPKSWSIGQRVGSQMIGVPPGFLIDPETGVVSWTPAPGPTRAEFVVISVVNPGGTDVQEFTVQVECDGPAASPKSSCRCDHGAGVPEANAIVLLLLALAWVARRTKKRS
jgi:PKD repeat protein